MSTYKVGDGHDIALESLTDVSPQPSSLGIQSTRRTYAASGAVYDEGSFVELNFGVIDTAVNYQLLLDQFGIEGELTNEVTVYVRSKIFTWVRMNGTAVQPEIGRDVRWDRFFPRNVTILIKDLVAAS